MAYHFLVVDSLSSKEFIFDLYLGSAFALEHNWESIGRKLNLPIISNLTEKADSAEGFAISSNDLSLFKKEMEQFKNYYVEQYFPSDLPEGFLEKVKTINEQVDKAIVNRHIIVIG